MYDSVDVQKEKYKLYQKESQTIQFNGQEQSVIASVPQMLPNFFNISMNETQDMSYQIRNFRFQNDFNNILAGDRVMLKVEIGYAPFNQTLGLEPDFSAVIGVGCTDEFYTPINLSRSASQTRAIGPEGQRYLSLGAPLPERGNCLTALEVVAILNEQVQREAISLFEQQLNEVGTAFPAPYQNFINFAMLSQFTYGLNDGRMTLVGYVGPQLFTPYTEYNQFDTHLSSANTLYENSAGLSGYTICTMQVTMITDPFASEYNQKRLAKLFGMGAYTDATFQGGSQVPIGMKTFTFTPQDFYAVFTNFYINNYALIITDLFPASTGDYTAYQTAFAKKYKQLNNTKGIYQGNFPPNTGALTSLDGCRLNVNRYDQIYIHTSLNTNYWDHTGSKQDLLDIVPVETSILELGSEHRHISRIYQSKDPNPRTFTISFTDEDNQPIVFNSDYQLALAFFYTA